MAKRTNFENRMGKEFRWPRLGDHPFVVAPNGFDNANVSHDARTRLQLMTGGYKDAGDIMVNVAQREEFLRDKLVYPIIFSYRQFLELSLKYQLDTYGPTVGIKPNWNTHFLEKLWAPFVKMLDEYGTRDPDEADNVIGGVVAEFAKIDPASYSFRYPMDRDRNPLPVTYADLHLPSLAEVMEAVENYFNGTDGYLDNLKYAGPG